MSHLITVSEAARRLGRPRRTIQRWVQDGRLPIVDKLPGVRGAYLISATEVDGIASSDEVTR